MMLFVRSATSSWFIMIGIFIDEFMAAKDSRMSVAVNGMGWDGHSITKGLLAKRV